MPPETDPLWFAPHLRAESLPRTSASFQHTHAPNSAPCLRRAPSPVQIMSQVFSLCHARAQLLPCARPSRLSWKSFLHRQLQHASSFTVRSSSTQQRHASHQPASPCHGHHHAKPSLLPAFCSTPTPIPYLPCYPMLLQTVDHSSNITTSFPSLFAHLLCMSAHQTAHVPSLRHNPSLSHTFAHQHTFSSSLPNASLSTPTAWQLASTPR